MSQNIARTTVTLTSGKTYDLTEAELRTRINKTIENVDLADLTAADFAGERGQAAWVAKAANGKTDLLVLAAALTEIVGEGDDLVRLASTAAI